MHAEHWWPEHLRIPDPDVISHFEKFPEGHTLAIDEEGRGEHIGQATCMRIRRETREAIKALMSENWTEVIATGHDPEGQLAEITGVVTQPSRRNQGIARMAALSCLRQISNFPGIEFVSFGARTVGYPAWKEEKEGRGEASDHEQYAQEKLEEDPGTRIYTALNAKMLRAGASWPEDHDSGGFNVRFEFTEVMEEIRRRTQI